MKLSFERMPGWPCLAWLASFRCADETIHVRHGEQVETRESWFCEAVWAGDFGQGDFDRTDLVFGSGCRLRNGGAVLVSSGSVSDRLHYFEDGAVSWVSNSLACLAAALNLEFDIWYPDYYEDFLSIGGGIRTYKSDLGTASGPVYLSYYDYLVWNGERLQREPRSVPLRDLSSFSRYRGLMIESLAALADNMRSHGRRTKYDPVSTASSGYDSLAVTILAREIGNREVITFRTDRLGLDDGAEDAVRELGLVPVSFERDAWRRIPFGAVPFIAADACGRDALFLAASERLNRRVLFSGYHGGAAWSTDGRSPDLARTDNAGLSLLEFRLQAGFLHCPVPVIGARQVDRIRQISASPEMQAWTVGGSYDRPIPRRIIEEAGIRRGDFARRKTATSVHLFKLREFERFMSGSESFRDYMSWLRRRAKESPPQQEYERPASSRTFVQVPLFRYLFPWALERLCRVYAGVDPESD